ncbi:MAG: dihydrolipoyl dehydrogenase family protein [Alphaproteobacteria bacterium]
MDGTVLGAENILIATGSKPRSLPIPGADLMIISDEVLLEQKRSESVVFVGGGVIAMEFSHVYARAGTDVTILEALTQLLPRLDADAVAAIQGETERIGVSVKTGVKVNEIREDGGKLTVEFEHNGAIHTINADRVVNGAGRVANVDTLDLEAGKVKHDGIAVGVADHLRSKSNPAVWVCGDALVTSPQLSPLATYEGRIVGKNIVEGPVETPDYSVMPNCVYTVPALANVGLTEAEAKERGLNDNATTNDMTGWFSGKSYGETVAFSKVLVDEDSDQIIGAQIIGHNGEELIQLFAFAMTHGITASQIKNTPTTFPTFSSDVKNLF